MTQAVDLLKAIRTGLLSEVIAALDAGAKVELHDGQRTPGLPLAMACFKGYAEIVRELAMRGAKVNFPDNLDPTSPLSVAILGGKTEVVKVLIEFGAIIPPGIKTGLSDHELKRAKLKAQHFVASKSPSSPVEANFDVIEEIQMIRAYGTDTDALDAEMRRAVQEICKK
ncbi:ankyrin repeat domain-containing protein [Propionivibrio sp.]|uniref:ankyrin repeat domain-containing protein n=1 Tax=Propionivibrio sp. TaxID=2212460 RepID=UPI0026127BEE|nr:ankyrin repeat domain-containing protein [Propionivibrio sp.]